MKIFRVLGDDSLLNRVADVRLLKRVGRMPANGEMILNWPIPDVSLSSDAEFDLFPADNMARVCSPRLVKTIAKVCRETEHIQWLPLKTDPGLGQGWSLLHFSKSIPVLDEPRCQYLAPGVIRKPAFQAKAVSCLPVFAIPGSFGFEFFARDIVKDEIERQDLKGVVMTLIEELPDLK